MGKLRQEEKEKPLKGELLKQIKTGYFCGYLWHSRSGIQLRNCVNVPQNYSLDQQEAR